MHRWMEGHVNVPTAVQSICELILVQCADFESTLPSEVVQAELAECLQRFVFRYLVTSPQISADDYVSISETGKGLRLAGSFIRLRDRILYGSELPSREELRHFAKQAMAHLKEDYWMQFGEEFVRPEQSFMLNGYRATFLSYLRADWEGMSDSAKEDVIKLALRKCGFIGGVCAEQYEAMATVLLEPGFLVPLSHE